MRFLKILWRLSAHAPAWLRLLGMALFAKRFIAGNGTPGILRTVQGCRGEGFSVNLSILGEAVKTGAEARQHASYCVALIHALGPVLAGEELSLSLKCSALDALEKNSAVSDRSLTNIINNAARILEELDCRGGHAYLDAEEHFLEEARLLVFQVLYLAYKARVRFVLQAYLRDAERTLERLAVVNRRESPIWIRLVRGAYWEHECARARSLGLAEPPVWTSKADTDRNYDRLFRTGLRRGLVMIPATHNVDSLMKWAARAPEVQTLFGLGDQIAEVLLRRGVKTRIYMPVIYPRGSWRDGMAYLSRRISESQTSFVFQSSGMEFRRQLKRLEDM